MFSIHFLWKSFEQKCMGKDNHAGHRFQKPRQKEETEENTSLYVFLQTWENYNVKLGSKGRTEEHPKFCWQT